MKHAPRLVLVVWIFASSAFQTLFAQSTPQITAAELVKHVKYLASDQLEGRKTGSKGGEAAAQYIANEFKAYGLKPIGNDGTYFQNFDFVAGVKLGATNTLAFAAGGKTGTLVVHNDFRPLGFSSSDSFEGGLVFVGYGISDTSKKFDDYAGVDVKGKAVIVFRNAPPSDSSWDLNQYSPLRYKASKAREYGAKALIVITGPEDSDSDDLMKLTYDNATGNAGIPAINVKRKSVDELLKSAGKNVKDLQKNINNNRAPRSFPLPVVSIRLTVELQEIRQTTKNVVGMLEGTDPLLKDQVMVIGAHYDHLGMGGEGSGSLKPDTVAVHHGADDNAPAHLALWSLHRHLPI